LRDQGAVTGVKIASRRGEDLIQTKPWETRRWTEMTGHRKRGKKKITGKNGGKDW